MIIIGGGLPRWLLMDKYHQAMAMLIGSLECRITTHVTTGTPEAATGQRRCHCQYRYHRVYEPLGWSDRRLLHAVKPILWHDDDIAGHLIP